MQRRRSPAFRNWTAPRSPRSTRGRFADAARQYRDAACLVPKSARAFYGLGIAEAAAGNFAVARKALQTAYSILPGQSHASGDAGARQRGDEGHRAGEAVLQTAAQRFPKDAELHSGLARFLAENQLLDLALAESLRFEQTGASDAASAIALAALENTVGAYDDAIRNVAPSRNRQDSRNRSGHPPRELPAQL